MSEEEDSEYASAGESSEEEALNSDALDEDTPPPSSKKAKNKQAIASKYWNEKKEHTRDRAKATSTKAKSSPTKSSSSPSKKRKRADSSSSSEREPIDGVIMVGRIHEAPETGRGTTFDELEMERAHGYKLVVPPGQISQNTFNFLKKLQDPKKNDREW